MTQEQKELLLKDLCARLPYGIKVSKVVGDSVSNPQSIHSMCVDNGTVVIEYEPATKDTPADIDVWDVDDIKPYLRPMSNMTEEERKELEHLSDEYFGKALDKYIQESLSLSSRNESRIIEYIASSVIIDWLNAHYFDFRGLIPRGLALEAPEGMYEQ